MNIAGTTALVTGANRGLGYQFAKALVARGATVYAGARDPNKVTLPGVTPIQLDITDSDSIQAAAASITGLRLLINNAAIINLEDYLEGDIAQIRALMETNYLGTLNVTRAFAPQLIESGDAAILNVLSVAAWRAEPHVGGYSATKAAARILTDALRQSLAPRGVLVSGLYVGTMDTDATAFLDVPKSDPAEIARIGLDGIETGEIEILADTSARQMIARLSGGAKEIYSDLA